MEARVTKMGPVEVKRRIAQFEAHLAELGKQLATPVPAQVRARIVEDGRRTMAAISSLKADLLQEASPLDLAGALALQQRRVQEIQDRLTASRVRSEQQKLKVQLNAALRSLTESVAAAHGKLQERDSLGPAHATEPFVEDLDETKHEVPERQEDASQTVQEAVASAIEEAAGAVEAESDPSPEDIIAAAEATAAGQPPVIAWPAAVFPESLSHSYKPYFLMAIAGLGTWLFFTRERR